MQHTCQDCDHKFFDAGQSQNSISPAVQCPQCHSYRTQPTGIPDEANDVVHGIGAMPNENQRDDMSGNPLQEGILADGGWKNRDVRDEAFASVRHGRISLFETPEFETTQLIAPPDLYRHAMETEASHRAGVQIPDGITDNLHAALGNLQAWVENPYENGELRPYYNKYWKVIRPSFMKPGALQIGVADPTMAEIINHVAQTDDLTPLYQYRGKQSHIKTAGPLALLAPEALGAAEAGGAAAAGTAGASEVAGGAAGAAAEGAGAAGTGAAASTPGIASWMKRGMGWGAGNQMGKDLMGGGQQGQSGGSLLGTPLGMADDVLGMGGGPGGSQVPENPHDVSFYARIGSDENDAYPDSHDEISKQEDGDYKQQDDGNHHEWQRDISVNGVGGTDHAPSFDPDGAGMERFMMLAPLVMHYIDSGEDGSKDPLMQGLHQSLEAEMPGYLDHADDSAGDELRILLEPYLKSDSKPPKAEETHADENSGGKHEARFASLTIAEDVSGGDFLPGIEVLAPMLNGMIRHSNPLLGEIAQLRAGQPPEVQHELDTILLHDGPGAVLRYLQTLPSAHQAPVLEGSPAWDTLQSPTYAKTADTQGPHTPEQVQAVQKWLLEHGHEMGLEGDELIQTILSVPTNPLEFADVLAKIQQSEPPPVGPEDAGMSSNPPAPAQEAAPPGATMPMPGMEQQMMSAVKRYGADSIATACPECGSHTTALLDEDGNSQCHACGASFKSADKTVNKINSPSSSLHKRALGEEMPSAVDDPQAVQGVPIADQQHQHDLRHEQDSGHTWADADGNPLQVGQEYEMHSEKYDIPDLIRIEAVKPDTLVYTLTGEFGIDHSTELSREEANIERITFSSTQQDGEVDSDHDHGLEENNDDNTGYTGPGRTDMSAPTGLVAASVIQSGVNYENPALDWLREGMPHTAGASYTPMEQRALIEESGSARNMENLDLLGTHYVTDADESQFLFGI